MSNTSAQRTIFLPDDTATQQYGAQLASVLHAGMNLHLHGDLGAGKTTLVRGILRGFGHHGRVKSPTYTLVEPYDLTNISIYHFDLYRFSSEEEWLESGFDEYFTPHSLCLIEWPQQAGTLLPLADITLHLAWHNAGRHLHLQAATEQGRSCLNRL